MNDKQIEEALNNISELKKAVKKNLINLRPIFNSKQFLFSILISCIFLTFSVIATIYGVINYQYFSNYPIFLKLVIIILCSISFIQVIINKIIALNKSKDYTILSIFKHPAFSKFYSNILIIIVTAISFYFILVHRVGETWLLLPILVISYAIMIIQSGTILNISEFHLSGVLIIVSALITTYFYNGYILLWSLININVIFYLLYFGLKISHERSK